MTPEIKEYIIEVLRRSKGDDLERATYAFSGFTAEQMTLQHGQSGQTRQQILDGYREERGKINSAITAVQAL